MESIIALSKELDDLLQELHPSPPPPILEKTNKDIIKGCLVNLVEKIEIYTSKRDSLKQSNAIRNSRISELETRLTKNSEILKKESSITAHSRILWEDTCRLLDLSRSRLASELCRIFPITQCPTNTSVRCIRGNPLPSSLTTEFKDRRTSVALGDTAQLILLLAQYLNVMLPYPIKLMGSFSQIMDPISCPQAGEVCRYSLYPTGNTVTDFSQALFLLNQNIQKLLESQKMVSHNSENTLANIDWLLQAIISKPVCLDDLSKISN